MCAIETAVCAGRRPFPIRLNPRRLSRKSSPLPTPTLSLRVQEGGLESSVGCSAFHTLLPSCLACAEGYGCTCTVLAFVFRAVVTRERLLSSGVQRSFAQLYKNNRIRYACSPMVSRGDQVGPIEAKSSPNGGLRAHRFDNYRIVVTTRRITSVREAPFGAGGARGRGAGAAPRARKALRTRRRGVAD